MVRQKTLGTPDVVDRLLGSKTTGELRQVLAQRDPRHDDELSQSLKAKADQELHADADQSQRIAEIMLLHAESSQSGRHRALALLAQANSLGIAHGHHDQAIPLYDEAASIYADLEDDVQAARSQIGKLASLATLGMYTEAIEIAHQASEAFEAAGEWELLAKTQKNLGAIHGRLGDDEKALRCLERAAQIGGENGLGEGFLAGCAINRAYALTNLGRFDDAVKANEEAVKLLRGSQEAVRRARAKQSSAVTYYMIGRFNEALVLLDEAQVEFLSDGRTWEAAIAKLFGSECLLRLSEYESAVDACSSARALFEAAGTRSEVGQTLLIEASAHAKLNHFELAQQMLQTARGIFQDEGNVPFVGLTYIEAANAYQIAGQFDLSMEAAAHAIEHFEQSNSVYYLALSYLSLARARLDTGEPRKAIDASELALDLYRSNQNLPITLVAEHLLGRAEVALGETANAEGHYQRSIEAIERLRSNVMIEQRAGYFQDKESVYQELVALYLNGDRPLKAFEFVERAKSRSLLELITHRVNLGLEARKPEHQALVEEILALRQARDKAFRRWASDSIASSSGLLESETAETTTQIRALEKQLEDRWHALLRKDADYASYASAWNIQPNDPIPRPSAGEVLVEYYDTGTNLVVFVLNTDGIEAFSLPVSSGELRKQIRLLHLTLFLSSQSPAQEFPVVEVQLQGILHRLHEQLIQPIRASIQGAPHLVVIPHGTLHYLPFQSLYDGSEYLAESHEISYSPSASLLTYEASSTDWGEGSLSIGYSHDGALPYAVLEAETVASIIGGDSALESSATISRVRQNSSCKVLHFATHGQFRSDNPLFSGISLHDGWLTTFDIFDLKLKASLVTLSACQTGRNLVRPGDELVGLTRALAYAGAHSLLMSLWSVHDQATADFMSVFYQGLADGQTKTSALQQAQLHFIRSEEPARRNPYYWGAFNLFGDAGRL